MSDCIFCDIIAGRAPASVVYEDQHALVILDLFPVSTGHALVIPRQHATFVEELDEPLASHLFSLARATVRAGKAAGLNAGGHNLIINDGPVANQHVPHVHLHVVPRRAGDTLRVASSWGTRMLNVFGREKRRQRLDQLAARMAQHFQTSG